MPRCALRSPTSPTNLTRTGSLSRRCGRERNTKRPPRPVSVCEIVSQPWRPSRCNSTARLTSPGRKAPVTLAALPSSTFNCALWMRNFTRTGSAGSTTGPNSGGIAAPAEFAGAVGAAPRPTPSAPATGATVRAAAQVKLAPSSTGWARRTRPTMYGLDKRSPWVSAYGVSCRAHGGRARVVQTRTDRALRLHQRPIRPIRALTSSPAVGPPLVSIHGDDSAGLGNRRDARGQRETASVRKRTLVQNGQTRDKPAVQCCQYVLDGKRSAGEPAFQAASRNSRKRVGASLLVAAGRRAHPVEQHRLGHPQQPDSRVRTRFAGAHRDVRAVRPEHLDDRADVADLALLAVATFERLHLCRHYLPDLGLVECHGSNFRACPKRAYRMSQIGPYPTCLTPPNRIRLLMALQPPYSNYEHEIYVAGMLGGRKPARPVDWRELERDAYAMLSRVPRGYIKGGAGRGHTIRANREAFDEWRIVPRMLKDVSERSLERTVLGTKLPAPVLLAPIGVQTVAHPEGELASARAAAHVGLPLIASTAASHTIEQIADAARGGSA